MKRELNICVYCGKFAKWEDLVLDEFIPDSEYTSESISYRHRRGICKK